MLLFQPIFYSSHIQIIEVLNIKIVKIVILQEKVDMKKVQNLIRKAKVKKVKEVYQKVLLKNIDKKNENSRKESI